ncbi:TetR/AcrR family transcriptional regulator [Neobacillus sp. FSL H8-0543]|uniref:TetR/AcrR family transcriptional regulator n=1 Tax=Neobacillus sp. FSL H8-0543 TaxID=2954672 RepID=UPI0031580E88
MSAAKIRDVALKHFAHFGYEGASLSKIAEEVGIKKPSIYAHYKGKDDLFLSVVGHVLYIERRRILTYFQTSESLPLKTKLHGIFEWLEQGFNESSTTKLFLRISFFPPPALFDEVTKIVNPFLDGLKRNLIKLLNQAKIKGELSGNNIEAVAIAYLTLIDGVLVELLYGGNQRYKIRVDAAWQIFWQGTSCREGKE